MNSGKTIDWQKLREDFPILNQQVHGKPLIERFACGRAIWIYN
ncbi:MAG: hypothetical protein ACREFE_19750 [Limisphaerales bacterium]